ncbi:1089b422-e985-41a4-b4b5-8d26679da0a7 [Sclerotinia trifoliorum]|uniref:1089b422-e985-41a4-b4b5-8d26679da0a7 n=1 Tax=Sclerotinia trifoliorum TaxID=28548 RepID=A0A8H2VV84_9HELO|nr:1089b422-e985-41a4-b4b5-8d26679da0a7 [Sclerotinia trifoliorum]
MVFGGQEGDFIGISKEAVEQSTLLKSHLDACDYELHKLRHVSIFPVIHERESIQHLPTLHAVLFATEYESAMSCIDSGMRASSMVGHSFGQLAALCISGSLSLGDAMKLVVGRAELIGKIWGEERGSMLSVQADQARVRSALDKFNASSSDGKLEVACFNHPTNHVAVGTAKVVSAFEATVSDEKLRVKKLKATYGFHSALTEGILPGLEKLASSLQWKKPTIPIELATEEHNSEEPGAWLIPQHTRKPVHFSSAVQRLARKFKSCIWVEAGQGSSVMSLVKHSVNGEGEQLYCPLFLNGPSAVSSPAKTAKEALFLVDPESPRYMYLLNGHIASDQALAPVSLYVELISRATIMLTEGASFKTHVINMDSMAMKGAPIGLDAKKNIYIKLKHITPGVDYRDLEYSSKLKEGGEYQIHVTGRVRLDKRNDPGLANKIMQWSAFIGYKRCLQIMSSEDGEKMQGKHIYRALQRFISFDEMYHGIKSISYQGHESAGKVAAELDSKLSPDEALYDAPTIDGMMQFAGILVNWFAHPSGKDVLLCQGINRVITGGTSVSVLQRSLRSVNMGGPGANPTPKPAGASAPKLIAAAPPAAGAPIQSSRTSKILEVLQNVTDVPTDELTPDATLEEIGIDSLLFTEAVCDHIDSALGVVPGAAVEASAPVEAKVNGVSKVSASSAILEGDSTPSFHRTQKLFAENKDRYERAAFQIKEAFAKLGYDMSVLKAGDIAPVHKVTAAVGKELAGCLTGEKDGLQIVFGNKENKKALDDLYENWPLVRSGTIGLGEYLEKAMANPDRPGKFRILEVGAGTGGTTKYIVRHLQKLGIPFEYVFTDFSASLVAAAKRTFKDFPEMEFTTLDIEKEPKESWIHSFHVVISTNCIHATRNLATSLTTIRKLLRDDGVVTLVEITQNMFWLDIVVGFFEAWWLFEDGREHAATHESL